MKTMTRSLLALILCLCMLGTTVLAAEGENIEQDALNCQVELTHVSLDPSNDALGYKAQITADEAVMSQVTGFGFELWIDGGKVITRVRTENIEQTLSLRLKNILAAGGGETVIYGRAFVTIGEETIYSDTCNTTMKAAMETVNGQIGNYSKDQILAVQKLLKNNADAVASWNVADILNWQEKVSFVSGTYVLVAMAGDKCYALGSNASGGVAEAIDVTGEDGQIVIEGAPEWNITVLDQYGTVSLTTAEGNHLWRDEGKANIYINDNDEQKETWKLAVDAEGYYTVSNADTTDSRYLAYNGSGFKAYAAASDSRFIQFMLMPTMPKVELTSGEYAVVAVAGDKYYALGATATDGVVAATEVTVENGEVTNFDTNKWNINVLDEYGTVTLTDAEGKYLMRAEGKANLVIGSGETKWQLAATETGYTLSNINTDVRYLAYMGEGFKAYTAANEERFIDIMLLPVKEKPVLTSGTYMMVGITKDGQKKVMGTTATSGVVAARDLVYVNGEVFAMDPWTITIGEDGLATITNAAGEYLVSNSGSANLSVGETETKWTVGVSEDGYFTFRNTHADMRYLAYNGTGFKVYSNSNVKENDYDIEFMMVQSYGLQSGNYVVVAKAGESYYALGNSVASNAITAEAVSLDNIGNANTWTVIVNADGTVSFRNAAGSYVNGKSSTSNMSIGSVANWTVAIDAEGYYTFNMGRYLAYMGTGFKAYAAANDSRFIQFMLIPVNEISSGKYNIVAQTADGKYYAMSNAVEGGVAAAQEVTLENGQITTEGVDYWNVNMVYGNSAAVITTADGQKLMRADGAANLVLGNTSHKWVVIQDAETGFYTVTNVNTDSRYLSFNGTGFKAYTAATDVRIINLLLIPIAE